jgi:DNA primase
MADHSDIFEKVRAATDIVEIIGEHVALKRAGKEFKGLCCFHDDHKPSMAVVPQKQIFHCFVCGTGGDVFKFVKEYHKLTNGEALRMLAQRAGIKLPDLPRSGRGGGQATIEGPSIREQIAATNDWACSFFQKHLRSPEGKLGLDYLHSRGLTDETIDKFRLGYAPDSWTALTNTAMRLGTKADALEQAGLIKKRQDGSPYDLFRGRVIFPIIDATGGGGANGRVIAFGGRVLVEKRDEAGIVVEAKYLNTPETRLFNKSESVYGLNFARPQIVRTRTAIVVEGYMDVIACHQVGVTNVIATLGTALTQEHARILKNYAQTIMLLFDSDDAGRRAADRALEVFVRGTLDIKLTSVPDGKDPCDFCMKNGGDAFQKIADAATDAMTYQWNRLAKQFHATESVGAKQEATTEFMRFVAAAMESPTGGNTMDPIRRGLLLSKLANLIGMSTADVTATLHRLAQQTGGTRMAASLPPPQTGLTPMGESQNNWPAIPTNDSPVPPTHINVSQLKGLAAAEAWLLGAILAQPPLYDSLRDDLSLTLFHTFQPLASILIEYYDNHPDLAACSLAELTSAIDDPFLLRQVIELDKKTSDWLEPQFSPNQNKMLKQATDERGLTLASVANDSLKELRHARSIEDPAITADLGMGGDISAQPALDHDAEALRGLQELCTQKFQNPRLGNTNFPK